MLVVKLGTERQGAKKGYNVFVDTLQERENEHDSNSHLMSVAVTESLFQYGEMIER